MAVREIIQVGNPVLRDRSIKVMRFDKTLTELVDDMIETMQDSNGVGLAAPQIGVLSRVIVVEMPDDEQYPHPGERFVLCNPKIVKASRETEIGEEGCLSVRGYVGQVERAVEVVISGQDIKGKKVRIKAHDFLARAFQHEIDHLNGVLYVDIAEENSVMTLEEYQELLQQEQEAGAEQTEPSIAV